MNTLVSVKTVAVGSLEHAIQLAVQCHAGQVDKGGAPYILHPLSVMRAVDGYKTKIAAVLHDVSEDTGIRPSSLEAAGFPLVSVIAIEILTHPRGEPYTDYIERVSQNRMATIVKVADLLDNMDFNRIKAPLTEDDEVRLDKYTRAFRMLQPVASKLISEGYKE